jgi:hypothetical protein
MRNILARHGYKFQRRTGREELWERTDGFQAIVIDDDEVLAHDGDPDPVSASEVRFFRATALDVHLAKLHHHKLKGDTYMVVASNIKRFVTRTEVSGTVTLCGSDEKPRAFDAKRIGGRWYVAQPYNDVIMAAIRRVLREVR